MLSSILHKIELFANETDNGSEADILSWYDCESLASIVPKSVVSIVFGAPAAASSDVDGKTENADAATAASRLLHLGVDVASGGRANGNLVAETRGDDELGDSGESFGFFRSAGSEPVFRDVDVPLEEKSVTYLKVNEMERSFSVVGRTMLQG